MKVHLEETNELYYLGVLDNDHFQKAQDFLTDRGFRCRFGVWSITTEVFTEYLLPSCRRWGYRVEKVEKKRPQGNEHWDRLKGTPDEPNLPF